MILAKSNKKTLKPKLYNYHVMIDIDLLWSRFATYYLEHRMLVDIIVFILMTISMYITLTLTTMLPIHPLLDFIIATVRVIVGAIYLLYLPGFLLLRFEFFPDTELLETFTLQIAASLCTIIVLGLILPDFEDFSIFIALIITCSFFILISLGIKILEPKFSFWRLTKKPKDQTSKDKSKQKPQRSKLMVEQKHTDSHPTAEEQMVEQKHTDDHPSGEDLMIRRKTESEPESEHNE